MTRRFAGQAQLAMAQPSWDPRLAADLQEVIEAAELLHSYTLPVGVAGRAPEVALKVGRPGMMSLLGNAELGPSAMDLVMDPPERIASLSFDPIAMNQRPVYGTLKQVVGALPAALHEAGLRPGDLVTANPEGIGRGDYRRALAFMGYGAGPVDVLGQQRSRIGENYELEPVLMYQVDPRFAQRMGWRG